MKVELDHLRIQSRIDSAEIAQREALQRNMAAQLDMKDATIKDQSQQVSIYRDLATAEQEKERALTIKLVQIKTQRTIMGYTIAGLVTVIAAAYYFR